MKKCTNCGADMQDSSVFCARCGTKSETTGGAAQTDNNAGNTSQSGFNNYQASYVPPVNMFDHTAEFDSTDISNNKVIAMLVYLMGIIGIIIALLASSTSKYAAFHVRQALKFTVLELITGIVTVLLFWTFLVPMVAGVFYVILFIVKIICFFSICKGRAVEPAIVRSFGFLN